MHRSRPRIFWARHTLRLRRAIPSFTGGNLPRQERLYVRVEGDDGEIGFGEAAPHATRGPTVDCLVAELEDFAPNWMLPRAPEAVRMAVLDAWSRSVGLPLGVFLGWPAPPRDGLASVLTFGGTNAVQVCAQIVSEKPTAVKIKLVGGETDLQLVEAVANAFDGPIVLDANRAWSRAEAFMKLSRLEQEWSDRILWIEEPCPPEVMVGRPTVKIPVLADESVDEPSFDPGNYHGVVLKPAARGLLECAQTAQRMRSLGKHVTLGCHLQSSLMTSATLQLAGFVTLPWVDLDTVALVEGDPFTTALRVNEGLVIRTPSDPGLGANLQAELEWKECRP